MRFDNFNNHKILEAIAAAAITASENKVGAIIDLAGFESATFIYQIGTSTAGATFTPKLEEGSSSTLSDAAAVADVDFIGTELGATFSNGTNDSNMTAKIGYIGDKQFVRLSVQAGSVTGGSQIAGIAVLGTPRTAPQSAQKV